MKQQYSKHSINKNACHATTNIIIDVKHKKVRINKCISMQVNQGKLTELTFTISPMADANPWHPRNSSEILANCFCSRQLKE